MNIQSVNQHVSTPKRGDSSPARKVQYYFIEKGTEIHRKTSESQRQYWKHNPVGTFERYLKSRYDTLKYCGFVIYDWSPSRNNCRKPLLYHKRGVHCIPPIIHCLSSKREMTWKRLLSVSTSNNPTRRRTSTSSSWIINHREIKEEHKKSITFAQISAIWKIKRNTS